MLESCLDMVMLVVTISVIALLDELTVFAVGMPDL